MIIDVPTDDDNDDYVDNIIGRRVYCIVFVSPFCFHFGFILGFVCSIHKMDSSSGNCGNSSSSGCNAQLNGFCAACQIASDNLNFFVLFVRFILCLFHCF